MDKPDNIFMNEKKQVSDFVFDSCVADIFEDMIKRSVPGYGAIVNMVGMLSNKYVQEDSQCYDLGCSLGACTLSMANNINKKNVDIISVDKSLAMVESCRKNLSDKYKNYNVMCEDIHNIVIQKASMVVLNFTLQFCDMDHRKDLLKKIYDGMLSKGILVVSEKIKFSSLDEQDFQTDMHHIFKKSQGYSDLEISQKRIALENVLLSDTLKQHKDRLYNVGFNKVYVWFQCFNFLSIVAHKC